MARSVIGGAAITCVLLVACGAESDGRARPTPSGTIAWEPCDDGLSCASLAVPLDHDEPDGETIELALAVRPALDRAERLGVLLTNPGGPGASGIESLRSGLPVEPHVLDRFDVISWDPRGVGESAAIDCGPSLTRLLRLDPRSESGDRSSLDRLAATVPSACGAGQGGLADHLSTGDHAADIDSIRSAAGAATLSYLGFSYGTRLGLEYLSQHPERIRVMLLDSVVDPALDLDDLLTVQAREIERSVVDTPRAVDRFEAIRDRAEANELPAGDGTLSAVRMDRAAVFAGYDPSLADSFARAMAAAEAGDGELLDDQGRRYERVVDFGAYLATTCADSGSSGDERQWDAVEGDVEQYAPTLGPFVINELRPCAYWPSAPQPPRADLSTIDVGSEVLLLANIGDPAAPVEWARAVQEELDGSTLVEIAEQGHIALDGSTCAADIAGQTLIDGAVPDGADCR